MEYTPSFRDRLYADSLNTTTELRHHGIKGQKWGVRRFQNKDGSLTDIGRKRYSQLSWSDKYNVKVAAKDQGIKIKRDMKISYHDISKDPNFDPKSGLLLQTHKLSYEDDAKAVNPRTNHLSLLHNSSGYYVNCTHCTAAYDLRRRGYDIAASSAPGGGEEANVIHKMYPNAESKTAKPVISSKNYIDMFADKVDNKKLQKLYVESYNHATSINPIRAKEYQKACKKQGEAILKQCESFGPNARGNVCMRITCSGGHSLAFQNDSKGRTTFVDAQTMASLPKWSKGDKNSQYYNDIICSADPYFSAEILRYDNATPDINYMLKNHIINNPKLVTATDKSGNSKDFKVYQY